jgi:hypothetical protein
MSEPATTSTAAAPPKKAGKKVFGLPVPAVIAVVAGLGALGYMWWRGRHGSSSGAATSSTSTATTSGTDYSSELAELQAEIDQLTGGAGGSGGGSGTTSTGTGTGTTPKPVNAPPAGAATGVTKNAAILSWGQVDRATAYRVQAFATASHEMIHDAATPGRQVSLSGLKENTEYGWKVQAVNSAGAGPFSGDHHFTTKGALSAGPVKAKA